MASLTIQRHDLESATWSIYFSILVPKTDTTVKKRLRKTWRVSVYEL